MKSLFVLVALLGGAAFAADEVPAAVAEKEVPPPEFAPGVYHQVDLSGLLTAGIGASIAGDWVVGELGISSIGLRMLGTPWLLQWDAFAAVRLGELANSNPYTFFGGGTARGYVELGHRFRPGQTWSPYAGARIGALVQVMGTPRAGAAELNTINNSDGFGGLLLTGNLRAAGGLSYLDSGHSFQLVGFVQERLRAGQGVAKSAAFTEGGLSARLDLQSTWTLFVEASGGSTRAVSNPSLHSTDQTISADVGGGLRKWFQNGIWLGLWLSYGRELHHVVYLDSQTAYDSVGPLTFTTTAAFGFAFSRDR